VVNEQQKSTEIILLKENLSIRSNIVTDEILLPKVVTIMPISFTKHFQKPLL